MQLIRRRIQHKQRNWRVADLSTSLEHDLLNGCNVIQTVSYDSYCTMITVDSAWWVLMPWCLFGARASATIIMTQTGRWIMRFPFLCNVAAMIGNDLSTTKGLCYHTQPRTRDQPVKRTHIQHAFDSMAWWHFPRYWPFVRGIHRSPVNSPHRGQWRGALMFSLICTWMLE